MKNVSLTVNSNPIVSLAPPPIQSPAFAPAQQSQQPQTRVYSVSFSAQFDTEIEAQEFAIMLLYSF